MGIIATAAAPFSDLKRRVLDYDPAAISTLATDFCFDFSRAECFYGGLPADGAAATAGVRSVTIASAGVGGTPGTYPLVFTGGGGSGAAGTATTAGNGFTSVKITNPGAGYTSAPTVTVPGSGVVSPNITSTIAVLRNLAADANATIGRTGGVFGAWLDNTKRPIRNGAGLRFLSGSYTGFSIQKDSVPYNRVCEPTLEGFIDQVVLVTFRADSFTSGASMYLAGTSSSATGGWTQDITSGAYKSQPSGALSPGYWDGVSAGVLTHMGFLARYDVARDTSRIYPIRNGAMSTVAITGRAPSLYPSNIANGFCRIGGGGTSGPGVFNGTIYRLSRSLVGLTGLTNAEVATIAAREWDYVQGARI